MCKLRDHKWKASKPVLHENQLFLRPASSEEQRCHNKLAQTQAKIWCGHGHGSGKLTTIKPSFVNSPSPSSYPPEFSLSKLPSDCEITSNAIRDRLRCDVEEFSLNKPKRSTNNKNAIKSENIGVIASPKNECSSAVSHEQPISYSSDDDDEENGQDSVPVVRMADIGAAPFSAAALAGPPPSLTTKAARRRTPVPVIKLPNRRSFDLGKRRGSKEMHVLPSSSQTPKQQRKPSVSAVTEVLQRMCHDFTTVQKCD
ncbi:unnamed protein product [Nippostrongylus brasiliensis]|uniref:Uncharacterized protein n=1 Tax=Nippostrongylus brasiliensis TaxID=27835 RepID=A0A0N4XH28_NIPBR|nr:unnamed protein product [Nippostrongylus brasiliensis]